MSDSLTPDNLQKIDAYWRAANYLSVGQIYLQDNPLLQRPLDLLYVHLNRLIKENDLNMFYFIGAGHGGPGIVMHSYLEGSYTTHYPAMASWYSNAMGLQSGAFGYAGEESAGATFLRRDGSVWTTDKDGIATALLSAEITARTDRDPGRS